MSNEAIFQGREKQQDIRSSNIVAARAVADVVRTSLGPKGMDKLIQSADGSVVITNDGATVLSKLDVMHPAAKMLVDVSRAQDVEAGDGTTSVVVITGALLEAAQNLLHKGIHPSIISDAWLKAAAKCTSLLRDMAMPVNLADRDSLVKSAVTSLNSKVVSATAPLLAPLAVDAVLRIIDPLKDTAVDLNRIKVVKNIGGTIDDTQLVDGMVFNQGAAHRGGGPSQISGAKIGLIQYCLSAPKTNMDNSVVVDDYQQMDRILKEERKYILKLLKPIIKSGCNMLLIQKSILRDAVNDLALHYLAKKNIMVLKDIERSDIEFITSTLGCTPIADPTEFEASKLGEAERVEEVAASGGRFVKVTGVKNPGKTVSVLVRGSNRLVIDEAERSVHDALCVVRCLVKERYMLPGGGAPEIHCSLQLAKWADEQEGVQAFCYKAFAKALEVIPYTLAENAGLHPIDVVSDLRSRHANGAKSDGINVKLGAVTNILDLNVVQPLLVSSSAINLATECCRMLLKIDDIVVVR